MSSNLRKEVLSIFKKLHKTRLKTFQNDNHALQVTRQKINDEFQKNKYLTNEISIQELIKLAKEVQHEVETTVIQIVEKKPGLYEARITDETVKLNNVPYKEGIDTSKLMHTKKCSDFSEK